MTKLLPYLQMACALFFISSAVAQETGTTFYRTRFEKGRWWLIDPSGERFISTGVASIRHIGVIERGTGISPYAVTNQKKYGTPEKWREETVLRLLKWNFNTLGAWSDPELASISVGGKRLAYAPILNLGANFVGATSKQPNAAAHAWLEGAFPDVFDPQFEITVRAATMKQCTPRRDDTALLGWFTDNELRWGPDWRKPEELLVFFLNQHYSAPGRRAALDLIRGRYTSVRDFNRVWKTQFASWDDLAKAGSGEIKMPYPTRAHYAQNQESEQILNEADPDRARFQQDCEAFLARVAENYFRVTTEAIRAADPNHLIFGSRFAYVPAPPVVAAAAKYLDAVSFNCYEKNPRAVIRQYAAFRKPLIIGEFSFRAKDSGLPNTKGAGSVFDTQAERARAFEQYVQEALSDPNLVGYHWFQYVDQPAAGRQIDGENSNYGVVTVADEPYAELTTTMQRVNAAAEKTHARAK